MAGDLSNPLFDKARTHEKRLQEVVDAINDLLWGQVIVKVRDGEITRFIKSEENKLD